VAIYFAAMQDLELDQVRHACALAVQTLKFFPTVAELRELATPYVDREAEATLAFEAVIKMGRYTPTGPVWNIRHIAEQLGPVPAEAYVAAGATRAFAQEQGEGDLPFLRKRFVESYVAAAIAQSKGRELKPAESQFQFPLATPARRLVEETAAALGMDARDRQLPSGDRGDAWEPPR